MPLELWHTIRLNNFVIPDGYSLQELTPKLLDDLASPDVVIRDLHAYSILEQWIQRGYYSEPQLRLLLRRLLLHLEDGLGEPEGDHVFVRSFSALTIAEIIKYDNTHPFLKRSEILHALNQSLMYLIREKDLRGHIPGLGWIHTLAHSGDLLGVLARNRYLKRRELKRILAIIAEKVTTPVMTPHVTLEDERLALAVFMVHSRGLLEFSDWRFWLRRMARPVDQMNWEDTIHFTSTENIHAYHNARQFLRSVYFQLTLLSWVPENTAELLVLIKEALHEMDAGFYAVDVLKIIDPSLPPINDKIEDL